MVSFAHNSSRDALNPFASISPSQVRVRIHRRPVSVTQMDLSDLIGHTFGPHSLRVCVENVADLVRVTGDDLERWQSAAPPAFLAAALFVVAPDLLGQVADRSVIHGEQVFSWDRPLAMESQLAISGTVSKVRERGGVSFVGFDLEVSDDSGPVAGGSSLFLISGESAVATSVERPEPEPDDQGSPGSGQVAMSRADLVKYAAATRDWNPIHWDHEAAVEAGLPGVVVHGLAQASWALAAAARLRAGDRPLASARIRFRNPLLPAVPVRVDAEEIEGIARVAVIDGDTEYLSARIQLAEE